METPRLLLLHGFGAGPGSWGETFPKLLNEESVDVHPLTAPGHNHTPQGDPIKAVLREMTTGDWLCGWSMGGYTALRVALNHPEKVGGLILLATGAGGCARDDSEAFKRRAEGYATVLESGGIRSLSTVLYSQPRFSKLGADNRELLNKEASKSEAKDLAKVSRTSLGSRIPVRELQGNYPGPVLVVHGTYDPCSGPTPELFTLLPNAVTLELSTGHAIHLEDPETLARNISHFINTGAIA